MRVVRAGKDCSAVGGAARYREGANARNLFLIYFVCCDTTCMSDNHTIMIVYIYIYI